MKSKIKNLLIALAFCPLSALNAQTEVMAWGNITGYRIDGELIEFETSLRVGEPNKGNMEITGKEKQSYPIYHRDGNIQKVTTLMKGIQLHQTVEELQHKETKINLIAESDTTIRGEKVYFCVELPAPRYGSVIIDNGHDILLTGKGRRIKIEVKQARKPFVRRENGNQVLYIPLMNSIKEGRSSKLELRLEADGEIDHSPARLELDTKQPGQLFVGFGGNFRLQNPDKDPAVIDYCLNNLRVAYGRVEMPWQRWQPDETTDPATHRYIGAVSFHSWRGCDDETLRRWAAAARQINKPLIVGEGSTDAAAWRYPEIFGESTFAFYPKSVIRKPGFHFA